MRSIHFGPDIIYLGETLALGRRPFAGLNKPQSCVEEHIKPKATPLIKRAALARSPKGQQRAKQPVYVVVVVSRKPWVMTFASGTVFPASMKPYSLTASQPVGNTSPFRSEFQFTCFMRCGSYPRIILGSATRQQHSHSNSKGASLTTTDLAFGIASQYRPCH